MGDRVRPAKNGRAQEASAGHLSPEEIGKFSNGELTAAENRRAQKHLAGCDQCRHDLVELIRLAAAEVTEEERRLLQSLPAFESGETVRALEGRRPAAGQEERRINEARSDWWQRLKAFFPQPAFTPAFAAAVVAVVVLGSFGGYRLYLRQQINGDVRRGYEALQQQWHVSENDFRPAGNFPVSMLSRPHSAVPAAAADPAAQAFASALSREADNRQALLGLALMHSFSGRMGPADSLLQILLQRDSTDAEAWNQYGLILARREQDEAALAAFTTALRQRPDYHEAAYNRALLLTRQRRRAEAAAAWREYLRRDGNSAWSEAARAHARQLEQP